MSEKSRSLSRDRFTRGSLPNQPDNQLSLQLSSDKTGSCVMLAMVFTGLNWMRT